MEKRSQDLTFGKRNFFEFLEAAQKSPKILAAVREICLKEGVTAEEKKRIQELTENKIKISIMNSRELEKIAPGKNHQGYILIRQKTKDTGVRGWEDFKRFLEPDMGPILVLDRLQDPGNLGSIFRTAECFGVQAILLSDRDTSPINETVEKTSAGAVHSLNIFRVSNLSQALEVLKEHNYWIVATDEGGEEEWDNLPDAKDIVFLFGNEGEGLKRILLEKADFTVRIPLSGVISSLNVSVAAGISLDRVLYDR